MTEEQPNTTVEQPAPGAQETETEQTTETAAEEPVAEQTEQTEEAAATEDQWREALETAVKQRDDYLLLAQRTQADFQNFKRRTAATRTEAYDEGVRETIAKLLPTIDNLDRAIAAGQADAGKLLEGVEMTRRQMLEALGKLGLEEVPSLGEKFNPDLHNAVLRAAEGEPGTILEVFEKGYRVKDRIIRYAMVKVAAE